MPNIARNQPATTSQPRARHPTSPQPRATSPRQIPRGDIRSDLNVQGARPASAKPQQGHSPNGISRVCQWSPGFQSFGRVAEPIPERVRGFRLFRVACCPLSAAGMSGAPREPPLLLPAWLLLRVGGLCCRQSSGLRWAVGVRCRPTSLPSRWWLPAPSAPPPSLHLARLVVCAPQGVCSEARSVWRISMPGCRVLRCWSGRGLSIVAAAPGRLRRPGFWQNPSLGRVLSRF
jgi:hypothetical protein